MALEGKCPWPLRCMRVRWTRVYVQLPVHLLAQLVLRKHSRNRLFHHALGTRRAHFAGAGFGESAGISGVTAIQFLLFFAPREAHLRGIDYDDVIAHVEVWRVAGFMLTHQYASGFARYPSQDRVFGINHMPVPRNVYP